ncbi:MAG: hypothetical protein MJ233_00365 [Mycoplasmoidaceae bacterium]|nr:hypothetical protein [Mycoplasmoidaceae bacterium]
MTKKIPHVDPTTGQLVEQEITITEAITETFTKGFSQIFFETQQEESEETEEKIAQDLNNLAESWNFIIENYEDDVTPLFESTNVTTFVSSILETMFGEKQTVDDAMVTNFYGEGCLFDQMASAYQEGKYGDQDITKLMPINVSEDSYNAIEGAIMNTYIFECDDTNKGIFEQKIQDVIAMVFVPPWLQQ